MMGFQLLRPATGTFQEKSDAQDGGREFFCLCFRAHPNARENMGFFLSRFSGDLYRLTVFNARKNRR